MCKEQRFDWLGHNRSFAFSLTLVLLLISHCGMSAPVNDNFANRIHLSGVPALTNGNNIDATREPGDPSAIATSACNATVWWSWTAPSNGQYVAIVIMPQPEQPLVDVYTGSMETGLVSLVQNYSWTTATVVRHGTNCNAFQVPFQATAGTEYQIVVGAQYPTEDAFELAVSVPPSIQNVTPTNGTDFPASTTIPLAVNASTVDGINLASVEYSVLFGQVIGVATNAPWSITWSNVPVGRYQLVAQVTDDLGGSATAYSQITVGRPPNDDFANRIVLSGVPAVTQGPILGAGKEPGEDSSIGYYISKATVWWSWTAPSNGVYAVVANATNPVIVGVYTGNSIPNLLLNAFTGETHLASINGQSRYCSQLLLNAVGGTTYQIVVDDSWQNTHDVGLAITLPPRTDFITPTDGSVFASPNGIPMAANPQDPDGNIQRVEFYEIHTTANSGWTVPIGTLASPPWNLTWNNASIGNYSVGLSVTDGLGAQTRVSRRVWVGVTRPPNDDFAQRTIIPNTSTNITLSGSNDWASVEPGEPYGQHSVWWTWTAPASGQVTIDTKGSTYGTYAIVYTGSAIPYLTLVASSSDPSIVPIIFTAQAGVSYAIWVDGGPNIDIILHVFAPPAPTVQLTRASRTNGTFQVQFSGVPGQHSILEASTNMSDWLPLATNSFIDGLMQFQDVDAAEFSERFYRVRQE